VDNVTHALLGAALAEVALPRPAARPVRRLFMVVGVVAANLPDLDVVLTGLSPEPLGNLLHHRGYTHTVVGLVAQALLLCGLGALWPAVRRLASGERRRLAALVGVGLASHLALDSWNVYGIHPFAPFDARWFYGDAVFIFEPWLWLFLGGAVAANAGGRTRAALAVVLLGIVATAGLLGVVAVGAVAALALGAILWTLWLRAWRPRGRAWTALAASGLFVASSFALAESARVETVELLPTDAGRIVDIVRSPQPAAPLCWSVIAITERDDVYVLRRGTLSLAPALQDPARCGLHRTAKLPTVRGDRGMLWTDEIAQPLDRLRALQRDDCWVRAWLQFARAPVVDDRRVFDLRFETLPRDNFTAMPQGRAGCPAHVTGWTPPRADLLVPR
jgi:inner membrane protein